MKSENLYLAVAILAFGLGAKAGTNDGGSRACLQRAAISNAKAIIVNGYPGNGILTATYDVTNQVVTVNSATGHEWKMTCELGEGDCSCDPETQVK